MLKAKDIMTKHIVTVRSDTSVQAICRILATNRLSGVPVVNDKNKIVGFVSERDIIAAVNKKGFLNYKAGQLMTRKVHFVREGMSTEEVSRMFTEQPIRYLPVIKNRKVIGVISRKDVIHRLLGQYY